MKADFPHARTIAIVESWRGNTSELGTSEYRYYLSSMHKEDRTPGQWMGLIRGHWAGVENRNHWRKDACWLEDGTRSRNPNIVGALILLRNALLMIYDVHRETYGSLPAFTEAVAANSYLAQKLISRRL